MNAVWLGSYLFMWALLLVIAVVLLSVMRNMGRLYHMLEQAQPAAVAPSLPLKNPFQRQLSEPSQAKPSLRQPSAARQRCLSSLVPTVARVMTCLIIWLPPPPPTIHLMLELITRS